MGVGLYRNIMQSNISKFHFSYLGCVKQKNAINITRSITTLLPWYGAYLTNNLHSYSKHSHIDILLIQYMTLLAVKIVIPLCKVQHKNWGLFRSVFPKKMQSHCLTLVNFLWNSDVHKKPSLEYYIACHHCCDATTWRKWRLVTSYYFQFCSCIIIICHIQFQKVLF